MKQLKRLEAIQANIEQYEDALALIALGSVGPARKRLDQYSDIDFILIVRDGKKEHFLENPQWLEVEEAELSFLFRNSKHGFKLMYEDGIFAEQAVWEESQVEEIVAPNGRTLWRRQGYELDPHFADKAIKKLKKEKKSLDFHFQEALTNVYVGLNRYMRGEKLAGSAMIQYHALRHLLHSLPFMGCAADEQVDLHDHFRRAEKNYPKLAAELSSVLAGIDGTAQAAEAVLAFLEKHWTPNETMVRQIRRLIEAVSAAEH